MTDSETLELLNKTKKVLTAVKYYKEDPDHVLRRQFKRLHLYNLYSKHNRLVELDEAIGCLERDLKDVPGKTDLEWFKTLPKLDELLEEIDFALKDFDAASQLYCRVLELPSPPRYFVDWQRKSTLMSHPGYHAQYDKEAGWSECAWHAATEKGVIHRFIDRHEILRNLFKQDEKEDQETFAMIYKESSVRRAEEILINIIFCLSILLPIFVLSFFGSKIGKLMIVFGFVLIAAVVTSFLANTVYRNTFTVLATYTAVLVVFLGTGSGSS